ARRCPCAARACGSGAAAIAAPSSPSGAAGWTDGDPPDDDDLRAADPALLTQAPGVGADGGHERFRGRPRDRTPALHRMAHTPERGREIYRRGVTTKRKRRDRSARSV